LFKNAFKVIDGSDDEIAIISKTEKISISDKDYEEVWTTIINLTKDIMMKVINAVTQVFSVEDILPLS